MMKFTSITQMSGDGTQSFSVDLKKTYTLEDLVKEILLRKEWGYISITGLAANVEFKMDKLLSEIKTDLLPRMVDDVKASGGWTRMDYVIKLKNE